MKLRIARPSKDIDKIAKIYCLGLDFEIIGGFKDHGSFDGIMIGNKELHYHFEFTKYNREGLEEGRQTGEDLIVFYIRDKQEWENRCEKMKKAGFEEIRPFNSYWSCSGKTFLDPDGYRVVIQNGDFG